MKKKQKRVRSEKKKQKSKNEEEERNERVKMKKEEEETRRKKPLESPQRQPISVTRGLTRAFCAEIWPIREKRALTIAFCTMAEDATHAAPPSQTEDAIPPASSVCIISTKTFEIIYW